MKTSRPATSRASRASRTPVELIRSNSSSRKKPASLRRLAPKVFVSISSAPARMKLACSATTLSGARRFASSGQRRRGTAPEMSAPMPPSPTSGVPERRRSRKRADMAATVGEPGGSTPFEGRVNRGRVIPERASEGDTSGHLPSAQAAGQHGRSTGFRIREPSGRGPGGGPRPHFLAGAGSESAEADSDRAKTPEGGCFAASPAEWEARSIDAAKGWWPAVPMAKRLFLVEGLTAIILRPGGA